MAKPLMIEMPDGKSMPILYEDRSAIAVDKPSGWVVSAEWQTNPDTNLQLFLQAGVFNRDFWARSRNLKFIRFVHRLDSMTSGVLLLAKSQGAIGPLSRIFESGQAVKEYLAVVDGIPEKDAWSVEVRMEKDPDNPRQMMVTRSSEGKESYTEFRLLHSVDGRSLIHARPFSGRTHQIRIHLAHSGFPITGDNLYNKQYMAARGRSDKSSRFPLGLRAIRLAYKNPFEKKPVRIQASSASWVKSFHFPEHTPIPQWTNLFD